MTWVLNMFLLWAYLTSPHLYRVLIARGEPCWIKVEAPTGLPASIADTTEPGCPYIPEKEAK